MPVVLIMVTLHLLLWAAPVKPKMRAATAALCLALLLPSSLEARAPLGPGPEGAVLANLRVAVGALQVGRW